jgi:hypothetical protein
MMGIKALLFQIFALAASGLVNKIALVIQAKSINYFR